MPRKKKKIAIHRRILAHAKDHFIPHEGNDHVPHVLKHRVLFGYTLVLILVKAFVITASIALPSSSLFSSAVTPKNVVDLTNQTRRGMDLPELEINAKLSLAAEWKAKDMLAHQYFAHTSPSGTTPWTWIKKAGYRYRYAGENLAVHYTSAEGVQDGWLASPTHRANIVSPKFTEIGVGVASGEFEGFPSTVVVQLFGAPQESVAPAPANTAASAPASPVLHSTPRARADVDSSDVTPSALRAAPVSPVVAEAPSSSVSGVVTSEPIIDESSLRLIPQQDSYKIRLTAQDAVSVTFHLGDQWVDLLKQQMDTGIWTGELPYDANIFSGGGEQLFVTAMNGSGKSVTRALAFVAPNVQTQQFFTFTDGSNKTFTLFGFIPVENLQDGVRRFYVYTIVALCAALLVSILVKIRVQRLATIGHTTIVIAVAFFLLFV